MCKNKHSLNFVLNMELVWKSTPWVDKGWQFDSLKSFKTCKLTIFSSGTSEVGIFYAGNDNKTITLIFKMVKIPVEIIYMTLEQDIRQADDMH